MPTETPSLLELMDGRPVYSDAFEFKGQRIKFKLLDEREISWCRVAAQKMSYKLLLKEFDDDKEMALDLLKNHSINYDEHTDWYDCFVLSSSIKSEDGGPISGIRDPYALAEALADAFTPIERAHLVELYLDHVDENDPNTLTDEQVGELIEEVKKKPDMDFLTQFGSRALRILLLTLVAENMELMGALGEEPETTAMDKS
jgi:hypothetical protein